MAEILFLLLGRNVCSVRKLMFNVAERTNGDELPFKTKTHGLKAEGAGGGGGKSGCQK